MEYIIALVWCKPIIGMSGVAMRKTLLFTVALFLLATSVYSQTLDTVRVNTQTGYDIYRSNVLIERHTTTFSGENVYRYVSGPGGTCAAGSVATDISATGILTCSTSVTGFTLATPLFTGQWTVNGSLCAANNVLQGGSPTTCTSAPLVTTWNSLALTTESIQNWRQTGFVNPVAAVLALPTQTFGDVQANSAKGGLAISGFNDATDASDPLTLYGLSALNGAGVPNVIGSGTASVGVYVFSVVGGCCGRRSVNTKLFRVQHFQSVIEEPLTLMANGSLWLATGSQSSNENSIGTTTTPGLIVQNLRVAAASGSQQYSPGIGQIGFGWSTNAGGASMPTETRMEVRPVQGAAAPTFVQAFMGRVNSGAWSDLCTATSVGAFTSLLSVTSPTINATTAYQFNGNSMAGTTGAIGGGVLIAGACTSGTVAVTGSTTTMTATVSPNTYPGDGVDYFAYVSANGTVTVKVCAIVGLTPTSSTYNVRVQP